MMKKLWTGLLLGLVGLTAVHAGAFGPDQEVMTDNQMLVADVQDVTEATASLEILSAAPDEMTFKLTSQTAGAEYAVLMTTDRDGIYIGKYAAIPADAQPGKEIDATTVLYVGGASAEIKCPVALESNRVYYFGIVRKEADAYAAEVIHATPEPYYMTPATLPFTDNFSKNLSTTADQPFIGGWAGTTNFTMNSFDGAVSAIEAAGGEALLCVPAVDYPKDMSLYVEMTIDPKSFTYRELKDGDTLRIDYSVDNGRTFSVAKMLVSKGTVGKLAFDISGYKDCKLQLRVWVKCSKTATSRFNVKIRTIKISAIPLCPNPSKLKVQNALGGTLEMVWSAGLKNETQWQVSTAPAVAEGEEPDWSAPDKTDERSYYFGGLADQELYNVRVQGVCKEGLSEWIEVQVRAGRVPSFMEDFDHLDIGQNPVTQEWEAYTPANWKNGYTSNALTQETPWYLSNVSSSNYVTFNTYRTLSPVEENYEPGKEYNAALAIDMDKNDGSDKHHTRVVIMPTVELNPAEQPKLVFDLAYGKMRTVEEKTELGPIEEADLKAGHSLKLWISTDSGKTIIPANPTLEWKLSEMGDLSAGKKMDVDLSAYKGMVTVVFGAFGTAGTANEYMLFLDNIGIINEKAMARNLKYTELSGTAATIQWVADPYVENWLVKLTGGELAEPKYFETKGHTYELTDLIPEQTYTAYVSQLYLRGDKVDTAEWVSVEFTTLGSACAAPTEPVVSAITGVSAVLTWQGTSADGYRIRYRAVAADGEPEKQWYNYTVPAGTVTYTFMNLLPGKEYEGEVTGICNEVVKWESDKVAFENFTTLPPCAVPTNVSVVSEQPMEVKVAWEGSAATYEVNWVEVSGGIWKANETAITGKTYTITGLTPKTRYQFKVRGVNDEDDMSQWTEVSYFETPAIPCSVPTELSVIVSATEAQVTWKGESAAYQVAWAEKDAAMWNYGAAVSEKVYTIAALKPATAFQLKVRGICAPGDSSEWSMVKSFETEALPMPCNAPTNLRVEDLKFESATLLWDAAKEDVPGDIQGYVMHYRMAQMQVWDSVVNLKENKYALSGLTSETAYVWSVRTVCTDKRTSEWAKDGKFETPEETAVEDLKLVSGLYVAAAQGQIYVMNPKAVWIDNIRIYSTAGHRLAQYAIRSNDNVVLTTEIRQRVAVVEVEGEGRCYRFKLLL